MEEINSLTLETIMTDKIKCPKHTTGGGPCYCKTTLNIDDRIRKALSDADSKGKLDVVAAVDVYPLKACMSDWCRMMRYSTWGNGCQLLKISSKQLAGYLA